MFVFLMLCFFARAGPSNAMRMKSAQATATPKHAAKMEEGTVEDTKKHIPNTNWEHLFFTQT